MLKNRLEKFSPLKTAQLIFTEFLGNQNESLRVYFFSREKSSRLISYISVCMILFFTFF